MFAVSGGHTPWAMVAHLAETMPWEKVTIYQVDERVAPDGDPDRNLTHLRATPSRRTADVRAGETDDRREHAPAEDLLSPTATRRGCVEADRHPQRPGLRARLAAHASRLPARFTNVNTSTTAATASAPHEGKPSPASAPTYSANPAA